MSSVAFIIIRVAPAGRTLLLYFVFQINKQTNKQIEYKTSPHIFTFADAKSRHLPDYFKPLVLWAFRCLRGLRVHNRGSPKHRVMAKHKHTFDSQSWLISETTRNNNNNCWINKLCVGLFCRTHFQLGGMLPATGNQCDIFIARHPRWETNSSDASVSTFCTLLLTVICHDRISIASAANWTSRTFM